MKAVRYECDVCGKRVPGKRRVGEVEHVRVRMLVHGYGLQDGDHKYHAHICSAKCGLRALKAMVKSIEDCEAHPYPYRVSNA